MWELVKHFAVCVNLPPQTFNPRRNPALHIILSFAKEKMHAPPCLVASAYSTELHYKQVKLGLLRVKLC